jgi:hypothetical protein
MSLCQLCGCEESFNFHHFIPRTVHANKWFKKRYTREQMREGIDVCKPCHKEVHKQIPDVKELARDYSSRSKLADHPEIRKFLKWKRGRAK